jgi:H+/Cl- antiporter ClcA
VSGRGRIILLLSLVAAVIVLSGIYGSGGRGGDVCPGESLAGQMWDAALHWWDPQRNPPACRRQPV